MALKDRIAFFDLLCSNFSCDRPAPLIAVHKIDEKVYDRLNHAVRVYVSRCISQGPPLDEEALLEELEFRRDQIPNCTPNGLIKPYRHVGSEVNKVYEAFAALLANLKIESCVQAFYGLVDVRFKEGMVYQKNLGRDYSTEELHVDSWATGITDYVRVLIPILGDIEGNKVEFYMPPDHFKESWLYKLPNYKAGLEITRQYSLVNVSVPRGSVCFFDGSVVHRTVRAESSGGRISFGNSIYTKVPEIDDPIRPFLSFDDIMSIGKDKFLYFQSFDQNHNFSKNSKHWELVPISK